VRDEIEAVVRCVDESAQVTITFSRNPSVCDRDASIVSCVRDAVTHVTAEVPREVGVGFWMDAAVFSAAGIPTVNYGPLGEGAHAAVEWVDLASVARLVDILAESAQRFSAHSLGAR